MRVARGAEDRISEYKLDRLYQAWSKGAELWQLAERFGMSQTGVLHYVKQWRRLAADKVA